MSMLIVRWAEGDPRGALDYAQTENAAENGWLVAEVVGTWAEHDSAAAMAWVTQTPSGQERNGALQSLVSALVEKDRQGALSFVQVASDRPNRCSIRQSSAIGRVLMLSQQASVHCNCRLGPFATWQCKLLGLDGLSRTPAAYAWANGLPVPKDAIMPQNIFPAGQYFDPERPAQPRLADRRGRDQGSRTSRSNGPKDTCGTAWTELGDGGGQQGAWSKVLSTWAQNEPDAAATYVASLLPGEAKDVAVGAIARQLASSDPQTALSWIEKLPDQTTRQNALEPLVSQWSETDPKAAAEFAMDKSSGEVRQNLLAAISAMKQNNPEPRSFGPGSVRFVRAMQSCQASFQWLLKTIRVLQPNGVPASGDTQLLAAGSLISQWAGTDPRAASDWATAFPQATRDQLLANVMNRWVKSDPYPRQPGSLL
jgi:hypothetical protein